MPIEQTPIPAFDYLDRATEYLRAYNNLQRQGPFDWARYLLMGHAVEVALKAYLLPRGWTMTRLRKHFAHDLVALLIEAKQKGLMIGAEVEKDIIHLNHVHDNHLGRYPEYDGLTTNGGKGIVVVDCLKASVDEIVAAVRRDLARP